VSIDLDSLNWKYSLSRKRVGVGSVARGVEDASTVAGDRKLECFDLMGKTAIIRGSS